MEGVVYFLVFSTIILVILSLNEMYWKKKKQVKNKFNYIKKMTSSYQKEELEDVFMKPIADRIVKPAYDNLLKFIRRVAPKQIKEKYEVIISNSGFEKGYSYARIIVIQILMSLFLGGIFFMALHIAKKDNILIVILAVVIGFIFPISYIKIIANKRKKKIMYALPELLDLLYVSVEAGLGFDMALQKIAEKLEGPLSDEINKTLDEISKGRERQEALRSMVKRTGVEDLSYFVTSVIQTEQLGSNIANMLRIQSNTMRQKRKQRAEEAAMKLPIKVLFPVIFFIFPTLFIVVLGPAIIRIIDALSKIF